ncbi:hypothetical protein LBMAG53_34910 [Planctomycetota bacterium]|nr:hypothetical protein LBMAG53_34910 [Planctomycetota bacterium]
MTFARLSSWAIGPWRAKGFANAVARQVERSGYDRVLAFGRTWPHDVIRLGMGCHATYLERMGLPTRWRDRVELSLESTALAAVSFRGRKRRVLCNSQLVATDAARRHGLPAEDLTVIGNGADLDRFHPRQRAAGQDLLRAALPGDHPIALFLGSGFQRKGLDRAVLALARTTEIRLAVAGRDGDGERFIRQAHDLGLSRRVAFLGPTGAPEKLLAGADLLVLPTRYDPFANVTIEALAAGTPVVTTADNGGCEVLATGTGATVDGDDPSALAEAMRTWSALGRSDATRAACRSAAESHGLDSVLERTAAMLLG